MGNEVKHGVPYEGAHGQSQHATQQVGVPRGVPPWVHQQPEHRAEGDHQNSHRAIAVH